MLQSLPAFLLQCCIQKKFGTSVSAGSFVGGVEGALQAPLPPVGKMAAAKAPVEAILCSLSL